MVPTRIARPLVPTDRIANRAGDPRSGILHRQFGFGGAWGLVKDDPQYRYIINGRVTWFF